jgi:hypothetical protein
MIPAPELRVLDPHERHSATASIAISPDPLRGRAYSRIRKQGKSPENPVA